MGEGEAPRGEPGPKQSSGPAPVPKTFPYVSSGVMENLVRAKYPGPEWIVLSEVRDGTGFSTRGREADAMAFGMYPSRGLSVVGFEFKSSRGDWLRELKDPAKAESINRYCDAWWLVTGEGVAMLEEVPATWGWYVAGPKGLKTMKPVATAAKPTELSRPFLMSIIRNISKNYVPIGSIDERVQAKAKDLMNQRARQDEVKLSRAGELEELLAKFKNESGIDLEASWSFPVKEVGAIVRAVVNGQIIDHIANVDRAAAAAKIALEAIKTITLLLQGGTR